jgi:fucose 4-O-acetylase-like acetyltransferase
MLTPVVRTAGAIDYLPTWASWYLRPAGEHTTFTAFPWAAFVFAGATVGILLAAGRRTGRVLHACLAAGGMLLIAGGFYTAGLPSIYEQSSFWTSSPTFFAIRVGALLVAFAGLYALEAIAPVRLKAILAPLQRLGRRSLLVYLIHVELVYGYATWPLHRRLPLWAALLCALGMTVFMYAIVVLVDRYAMKKLSVPKVPATT